MDFKPNPAFERMYAHSSGTREALQEAVMDVHDVFQTIAPRDTGAMVNSAHPSIYRDKQGWQAQYLVPVQNKQGTKYAKFVEFGTKNSDGSVRMRAQHNLQHALEEVFGKDN